MRHIKRKRLPSFVNWDGTDRLPRKVVVGYDTDWDSFFAQIYLGGDDSLPNVWIGMGGYNGAASVEQLAEVLRPYAHLPQGASAMLRTDRASTDNQSRNEARARRDSATIEGNESVQVHILHPVEGYLRLTDAIIANRVKLSPIGPVEVKRRDRCDSCKGKVDPGQALFLYVIRAVFMCGSCAFPGLANYRSLRARKGRDADLLESAAAGSLEGVWRALRDGANVNALDDSGRSALYHACEASHDAMARGLLAAGARPVGGTSHSAPLVAAILRGNRRLATRLMTAGAPVDAFYRKITPLLCAAEAGQIKLVQALLRKGANPNRVSAFGKTAVCGAIECGNRRRPDVVRTIVNELILAGARVNTSDDSGQTPLHWAAVSGDVALVELLLRNGAEPGHVNAAGESPVAVARRMGFETIAETLQANGPS